MRETVQSESKRLIRITAGNLSHGHLYVRGHYDLFPADAIGGSTKENRGLPIVVELGNTSLAIETDIAADGKTGKPRGFLRNRSAIRKFYAANNIRPGDFIQLERVSDHRFRISIAARDVASGGQEVDAPVMPTAAEFFAGIGLVRMGLERAGFRVVFANDHSESKRVIYEANHGPSDFLCADVRTISGTNIPDIDLATASFPCTDLSLAGNREGLSGDQSGMFWEFRRILEEMGDRKPRAVMLENVPGLATSNGGKDLSSVVQALNALGYQCDLLALDARHFIPQSRLRMFIIGFLGAIEDSGSWIANNVRPAFIQRFVEANPSLLVKPKRLRPLVSKSVGLESVVQRIDPTSAAWWQSDRREAFFKSLSNLQIERLKRRMESSVLSWATAFRRTRNGRPVWEIRDDNIAGCLRTTGGGSSKQAIVETGLGEYRVRWLSAREYARLQGAPNLKFGGATESQIKFACGDAVCVPVIHWLAKNYLSPLCRSALLETAHG